jgi:glutaredoxin
VTQNANRGEPGLVPVATQADMTRTAEARVTLITRDGCHLCDDARLAVIRVVEPLGVGWREIDVDADPERLDAYGDRVPVILVDGREHGYWRVEEERLRRALRATR